ncbi:MAG: virulence RhuM family protein [Tannerella sp.]|jgi:hypothetical protein|nr:virulence RhuM family protein [Tannerella sp.]
MKTGSIEIINPLGENPTVETQLVNNDIRISAWGMARLFNCFNQKIEATLRTIFKDRLLYESDVTFNYRYTDKGIEKQILYYNLEALIFVSYRIASLEARIFRQFVNSALREHLQKGKAKEMEKESSKLIWFFQTGKDNWSN